MVKSAKRRTYEVMNSFSGLNLGERFSPEAGDEQWAQQHVETGYLRDVTSEPTVSEAQGEQAPTAAPERVQEASHAGEERQG